MLLVRDTAGVDTFLTALTQTGAPLKGWRLVTFGDVGAVERAFGVDAASAVLLASSSAFGHHDPAGAGWSTYV